MTPMPNALAVILAGGEGRRLWPLTRDRAKPAVPFGGQYRLVDFALSNLVNAGFLRIVVLTQYKSQSLHHHIARAWPFVHVVGGESADTGLHTVSDGGILVIGAGDKVG